MMYRGMPNEPKCPVPFETVSLLLRSTENRVVEIVGSLDGDLRVALALFCVARAHMRQLGFVILLECDEALVQKIGGTAAMTLYRHAVENPLAYNEPAPRVVRLARCA